MDVPRKDAKRKKMIFRTIVAMILILGFSAASWAISRLKPAAPPVDRSTVLIDTVKRGSMVRDVRGLGTLVPEDALLLPANTDGRVRKILIRPGAQVTANSVIMILTNPELETDSVNAEWQVKAAEANYKDLEVKLATEGMDLKSNAAKIESDYVQAQLKAEMEQKLGKEGLTSELNLKTAKATADQMEHQFGIEKERLAIYGKSGEARLAAQRVEIERLKAAYALKRSQVDQLNVRAGAAGVLQAVATPVEEGQHVTAGTILAKVVQPSRLKAELKVAETQAKDILIGQSASVDTRNGIIAGHVMRIDPAVLNGTVTVDVKLDGELPQGARPDLSVDGTIELERLTDVLYVGRPVFGQEKSMVGIFKLDADGKEAQRVTVRLGRSSVNSIEVVSGLNLGDQVILSDMSAQEAHNRIHLN